MARQGSNLIVMGIDPSLTSTGYAFIDYSSEQFFALDYGLIKTKSSQNLPDRLSEIFHTVSQLVEKHHPDVVAFENVFYAKNPRIALLMGHARAASLVAAAIRNISVAEYSAREIKMSVSGYGNASKEQVKRMVLSQIKIDDASIGYDISDAFAVALCHLYRQKQQLFTQRNIL